MCHLLKALADAHHKRFGRRAATRIRSQLLATIYDKALKRKKFSGTVDALGGAKEAKEADASKAGANTVNINNLISQDVEMVCFSCVC